MLQRGGWAGLGDHGKGHTPDTWALPRVWTKGIPGMADGLGVGLIYPYSRHPRLSRFPMRTPDWMSPELPGLAGTGSPSSHWQLIGRTGWLTAHRAGQGQDWLA